MANASNASVIRVGTYRKKHVEQLRIGHGKLAEDVHQICESQMAKAGPPSAGSTYQPIILVYEEKESKKERKKRKKKERRKRRRRGPLGMTRKQLGIG